MPGAGYCQPLGINVQNTDMKRTLFLLILFIIIQSCNDIYSVDGTLPNLKVDDHFFDYKLIESDSLDSVCVKFYFVYHSEVSGNQLISYYNSFLDLNRGKKSSSVGWQLNLDDGYQSMYNARDKFNNANIPDTLSFFHVGAIRDSANFNFAFQFDLKGFFCDSSVWESQDTLYLKSFKYTFYETIDVY